MAAGTLSAAERLLRLTGGLDVITAQGRFVAETAIGQTLGQTSNATLLALLPLAAGPSEGSIIAAELGTVVIGGLVTSTLLTLLVLPVVYPWFSRKVVVTQ